MGSNPSHPYSVGEDEQETDSLSASLGEPERKKAKKENSLTLQAKLNNSPKGKNIKSSSIPITPPTVLASALMSTPGPSEDVILPSSASSSTSTSSSSVTGGESAANGTNTGAADSSTLTSPLRSSAAAEKAHTLAQRIHQYRQQCITTCPDPTMNALNFTVIAENHLQSQLEKLLSLQEMFQQEKNQVLQGQESQQQQQQPQDAAVLDDLKMDCCIDIGYHYTQPEYLTQIAREGLLSQPERDEMDITMHEGGCCHHDVASNGAAFGDGIYTANNPYAYHAFGGSQTGLLVARVKGKYARWIPSSVDAGSGGGEAPEDANTVLARGEGNDQDDVVVLRSSHQVAVLAYFSSALIAPQHDETVGNRMVYQFHCALQQILNDTVNQEFAEPVEVPRILPSTVVQRCAGAGASRASSATPWMNSMMFPSSQHTAGQCSCRQAFPIVSHVRYKAPETLNCTSNLEELLVTTTTTTTTAESPQASTQPSGNQTFSEGDCAICWEQFQDEKLSSDDHNGRKRSHATLKACGHTFHHDCLQVALERRNTCPMCRHRLTGHAQGTMPSGTMVARFIPHALIRGHGMGAISIEYTIPAGRQKSYHPNPGMRHEGAHRIAYVPHHGPGRALLQRLTYAFAHGLTFTVGTSLTTGRSDQVVWASIHHKTSLEANDAHGYPDPAYFSNVHEELDALGVPPAHQLGSLTTTTSATATTTRHT